MMVGGGGRNTKKFMQAKMLYCKVLLHIDNFTANNSNSINAPKIKYIKPN